MTVSSAFPLNIASRYTSRSLLDRHVGFGEDLPGYVDGRNRSQYTVQQDQEESTHIGILKTLRNL